MDDTHYISPDANPQDSYDIQWNTQIQTLNPEEFMTFLSQLEDMWDMNTKGDHIMPINTGFKNFFHPNERDPETDMPYKLDPDVVSGKYNRLNEKLGHMYHRAVFLKLLDNEDDEDSVTISTRINRLIDQVYDAWQIVSGYIRMYERVNYPTHASINSDHDPSIFRSSTMVKFDELTPYQQAIITCLKKLYGNNLRKYKGYCCSQIKTDDGKSTRAWQQNETIQEYVYSVGQKESENELWRALTSRGAVYNDVIRHLSNCKDIQFPEIKKNRHVWSFKNGIFIGKDWSAKTGLYQSSFYTYDSREFMNLDQTIVSCKYFENDFTNYDHMENWYDIPTPHFQTVLDYQKFDTEVSKWMYVMGGRLCFDVNDMDTWQIIPFLKGIARSGKSTLITKVFRKFYNADDVRTLSNNVEKKFGLSSIYDAFMFIAPEVKGDLQLEQAEFQSVVSGEDVSIAVKHEKAKSFEWITPGVLGGNEVPNWRDNSGSVLRRILTWNFGKQVKDADPTLETKLEVELPIILQKCVRAYLEYAQKYSDRDIWNVVPEYFKVVQRQVATIASTLENFLQSTGVKYGKELYCPQKDFIALFNAHCGANNLGKPRFTQDFYVGPFSQRDIEVREESLTYKGRIYPKQSFIFGIDIVDETMTFGNEY
jgi:hypothetical protein